MVSWYRRSGSKLFLGSVMSLAIVMAGQDAKAHGDGSASGVW
ncbi:hypothetical protein [Anaplasma phagocytophilum]|uniref:Putative membrane protein n=2 Tax=Anaplasma phagocytophilum TaxID=948 RepID=A0A0F3NKQ6_ANAPH|nr:hypothetical protein [Anaplasma phagocytophilum]AGR80460.1 hypothetical protein WSQ_00720 [Anaplasma phagocytophilum str. JM]AGR81715.1 hypothetical protein YYY_00720 [Anaplasma phagocytophilum str. Dog2]KJV59944.1 putative membrane protein [Anaplasma phagocytophilum str. Webster]KJV68633.1 putative membrane protein [Anaplasma phagocytophilum str. NCH-1]KJV83075.1 putative membrane protein [Anaplasma phagocytophilum str. HGE2]KJV85512.1 putative membrane protein [Anaplasma phagocytophilum 